GVIVSRVASPLCRTLSRYGFENGSDALASATMRCADGSISLVNSTVLPAISAGPRETVDQPIFDRISGQRHYNRDVARRLLDRNRGWGGPGNDQVRLERPQLRRQFRKPAALPLVRTEFVTDVFALDISLLAHRVAKQPPEPLRTGNVTHQDANGYYLRLL